MKCMLRIHLVLEGELQKLGVGAEQIMLTS